MCDAPVTARRCTAPASRARPRRRGGGHVQHRRRGRLRAARRRGRPGSPRPPSGSEFTGAQDALRTGWDPAEPGLAPKVLRSGRFGRVFTTRVRGQVYAQPLVVGRMVIAATEQDWVYGIDAVTGRVHWSVRLGPPGPRPRVPRPAAPDRHHRHPGLRPADGGWSTWSPRRPGAAAGTPPTTCSRSTRVNGHVTRQVAIGGHPVNDPRLRFSAVKQLQRPALLLLGPLGAGRVRLAL